MPSNRSANPSNPSPTTARPQPVQPVAGRGVNAQDAEFSWTAVPDADQYELQIAPGADFETLYFDASVEDHTTITVYDALPDDDRTCYWRVRAEVQGAWTDWSGVAHFAAGHSEAEQAAREARSAQTPASASAKDADAPAPVKPVDEAPVDGQAAVLEWDPAPDAAGYHIQVARPDAFASPIVDLTLDRTASLTLYQMLPEDGSTYQWRVRALKSGGRTGTWSAPATFTAASDEDVISYEAEQQQRAAAEAEEEANANALESVRAAEKRAEAESPVLTARTSSTFALTLGWIMVLSFAVTVFLIAQAV